MLLISLFLFGTTVLPCVSSETSAKGALHAFIKLFLILIYILITFNYYGIIEKTEKIKIIKNKIMFDNDIQHKIIIFILYLVIVKKI